MKLKNIDFFISLFFSILAILSGYRLFYTPVDFSRGREEVARIHSKENTVKKKKKESVTWIDADVGDQLGYEDQIYTYERSHAAVSFDAGADVDLMENTLFKIIRKDEKTNLKLERGLIHARFSRQQESFRLNVGGKEYTTPKKGFLQLVRKDNKERLTVIEGELDIGGEKKLKKNQFLEVDRKTGRRQVETLKIIPLSPRYNEKIYFVRQSLVRFRWKAGKNLNLLVAKERSFDNPVFKGIVKGNSKVIHNLAEGTYYWKIQSKKMDSGTRIFELIRDVPPVILNPPPNAVLKKKGKDDYGILLWSESKEKFKEKTNEEFWTLELQTPEKKILLDRDESKYIIDSLIQGKYSFRVKIKDKRETPWSRRRHFSVEEVPVLPPPHVISPEDKDYRIVLNEEKKDMKLLWAIIPGVSRYRLEVKKDDRKLLDEMIGENQRKLSIEESGVYLWRVRAEDYREGEKRAQFSKWHRFVFNKVEGRFEGQKIVLNRPEEKIPFFWRQDIPGGRNLLEISRNSDFKMKNGHEIKDHETKIPFGKEGKFFWRMRMNVQGQIIYTKPFLIQIHPSDPPDKPEIPDELRLKIFHERQRSFFNWLLPVAYGEDLPLVRLKWKKQKNAKRYIVEIYLDSKMKKRVVRDSSSENSYDFKNPHFQTYYWRYAVVDFWDQRGPFSNLSLLKIDYKKGPSLLSPSQSEQISSGQAIAFEWEEGSKEYLLQISKKNNFKEIVWEKKTQKNKLLLRENEIKGKGSYYWRVLSLDEKFISVGETRIFHKREERRVVQKERKIGTRGLRRRMDFFFAPAKTEFTQTSETFSVKMEDVVLNSFILKGKWHWEHFFFEFLMERRKGETSFERDYSFFNTQLLSGYSHDNFKWKWGLIGKSSSIFKANYFGVYEDETTSRFALSGGIEYSHAFFGKLRGIHEILFSFMGMNLIEYNLLFQYPFEGKMIYNGGVRVMNYSFTSGEIGQFDVQLLMGVGWEFD